MVWCSSSTFPEICPSIQFLKKSAKDMNEEEEEEEEEKKK